MSLRLIRLPEVRSRCGFSSMHIWRLEGAGRFPRRVKLSVNSVAWVEAEITAWCEARIAERDARQQKQRATTDERQDSGSEAP
jgi:prophage regulatory protein